MADPTHMVGREGDYTTSARSPPTPEAAPKLSRVSYAVAAGAEQASEHPRKVTGHRAEHRESKASEQMGVTLQASSCCSLSDGASSGGSKDS